MPILRAFVPFQVSRSTQFQWFSRLKHTFALIFHHFSKRMTGHGSHATNNGGNGRRNSTFERLKSEIVDFLNLGLGTGGRNRAWERREWIPDINDLDPSDLQSTLNERRARHEYSDCHHHSRVNDLEKEAREVASLVVLAEQRSASIKEMTLIEAERAEGRWIDREITPKTCRDHTRESQGVNPTRIPN